MSIYNMPDGCDEVVREDERKQEVADRIEEETYPYRRCIEDVYELAVMFKEKIELYVAADPKNVQLQGALQAAALHVRDINKLIDKYELREELDV